MGIVAIEKIKKLVLSYSGGLDTSVMLRWIKDHFGCEVIAYCADVGQGDETDGLEEERSRRAPANFISSTCARNSHAISYFR